MKRLLLLSSLAFLLGGTALIGFQAQRPTGQNPQQPVGRSAIEGFVTRSDNGQPLKGARVILRRGNNTAPNGPLAGLNLGINATVLANNAGIVAAVTTDNNGRFAFSGVQPGSYQIVAELDGFIRSEYGQRTPTGRGVVVPVASNQTLKADLKMLRASVVSGRVVTPDGLPAARASVQAHTYQYSEGERTLAQVNTTQTNDLGEYRLFWLQPGEYFISVSSNELTDGEPVGTVDLTNSRGRGAPGGATATIEALTSVLGDRGGFLAQGIPGNPPFYYPGTIDPAGAVPIAIAAATEVRGIDFNLQPVRPPKVSGRVVAPFPLDAGGNAGRGGRGARAGIETAIAQLARAPVQLSLNRVGGSRNGLGGLLLLGATPVSTDGTFEIKGVAPGEYNLTAIGRDANGQEYTGRTRVTVGNADVTNNVVTLRPGVEVRGRILLDGTPPQQLNMTNLRVNLLANDSPLGDVASIVAVAGGPRGRGDGARGGLGVLGGAAVATVAADGSFTLTNVGAMEYRVRVAGLPQGAYVQAGRIESRDALNAPFTVDSESLLQLQLGFSPGRVSGVVSDDRQTPTAGAQAVLVPDEARRGRSDAYFTTTTDPNGQFTFSNVPPGRYKLFAWEDVPPGAYQYSDFIRQYEDRGQAINVNPSGAITADVRLIPAK
jgi:hypothetical protein